VSISDCFVLAIINISSTQKERCLKDVESICSISEITDRITTQTGVWNVQ